MANEVRLIDANVALAGIEEFMQCYAEKEKELTPFWVKVATQALDMVRQLIKEMPTVDAVEVVRCCECRYGIWDEEEAMWKCVYSAEFDEGISEWLGFCDYNNGDHFCSYGERRNDE